MKVRHVIWAFIGACILIGAIQAGEFLQFGGLALICFALAIPKRRGKK